MASYEAASGTPVTMSYTWTGSIEWLIVAASFKAGAAAGATIGLRRPVQTGGMGVGGILFGNVLNMLGYGRR